MGTVFSFDVRGGDPRTVGAALAAAIAGLHRVNEVFSTYRENSQISRLARGEISVAIALGALLLGLALAVNLLLTVVQQRQQR